MKIRIKASLEALNLKNTNELAVFLNMSRQAGYHWQNREYLPELATRRLVELKPKLARLVEYD